MKKMAISMMVFCSVMALSVAAWCGGNGTVTVNGLVWLKDAGCLGKMNWDTAMTRPKSLADGQCGLTDKSKAGDWRLPTLDELKAIYAAKSQFKNVRDARADGGYWSLDVYAAYTAFAWGVSMDVGQMFYANKASSYYVWPVRDVK